MNQDQDPRKGLPSASSAERRDLCAGSFLLEQQQPDTKDEYAQSGDRVHKLLAGKIDPDKLNRQERDTYAEAKTIETRVIDGWLTDGITPDEEREQRLEGHDASGNLVCSGQPDAVFLHGNRALVEDLKSLWGDTPESPRNLQLRELAALVWEAHNVEEVTVFINQPRVTRNPRLTVYDKEDLVRAHVEMVRRAKRNLDPNAPRVPGTVQCKNCKAKAVCPEALGTIPKAKESMTTDIIPTKQDAKEIATKLPGDQLANYLEQYELVQMIGEAAKQEAKRRLEKDPDAVPGYWLKPGARRWELPASHRVAEAFSDFIPSDQFWQACCEPSKGLIQQYLELVLGYSANGAKRMVEERLEQIAEKKQNAPSLARKKEEE